MTAWSRLTEIIAHFRRERRPEAAVVPYELIELLDSIVEDALHH